VSPCKAYAAQQKARLIHVDGKINLREWLEQYDAADVLRKAQDAAAERRICGQCKTTDTLYCEKCKPLLN
jgi:acyl carrier protein phosphodiesterase